MLSDKIRKIADEIKEKSISVDDMKEEFDGEFYGYELRNDEVKFNAPWILRDSTFSRKRNLDAIKDSIFSGLKKLGIDRNQVKVDIEYASNDEDFYVSIKSKSSNLIFTGTGL